MSIHRIHVFISHSWAHSKHYDTLAAWIFDANQSIGQASLQFLNYSVPENDPIHSANEKTLQEAIFNKIARCHVIIIPTGMYAHHSKWIQKEIEGAEHFGKPILGVRPQGQQRKPSVVGQAAKELVGWKRDSVVKGIWRAYSEEN